MTQTEKNQPNEKQTLKSQPTGNLKRSSGRPGQRQQERLQRLARRRRRQQIIWSIVGVIVLAGLIVAGIFQYQRFSTDQVAAGNVHATATAKALITPTPVVKAPTSANATPPSVTGASVKQSDGLEYVDIKKGIGPAAKAGDTVTVYYTGWLQSTGEKFDSSFDDGGKPFDVTPLGQAQVIQGWNEGLIGVKSGGTRRLIIPGSLAYGAQGAGNGKIPPNATLIFDVTIAGVKQP